MILTGTLVFWMLDYLAFGSVPYSDSQLHIAYRWCAMESYAKKYAA